MKVYHYIRIPGAEHLPPKRTIYQAEPGVTLETVLKEIKEWPGTKLVSIPCSAAATP